MPIRKPLLAQLLAGLLVLLGGAPALAAGRDELLRLVPDDAAFCLVVQDLGAQLRQVEASPFARQWTRSVLGQALVAAPEWKKLLLVEQFLKKSLGVGWAELRDDLLGDAFAFAYRPGPPGKPEQEQGLFLLRAPSDKALAGLIDRLNAFQKLTGELKELQERSYKGVKYLRRVDRKEANFYLLRGPVLVFTHQESALRLAIDKDQALPRDGVPELSRRLRDLGLDRAVAALTIQPRAFDALLASKQDDPAARMVARCWKGLDGVGLGLHLKRDLELSLTIKARPDKLPPSVRRVLAAPSKASELWAGFPEDALFAAAGRLDLAALFDLAGEFLPPRRRQALAGELERSLGAMLGKDLIREVLPAIGPDGGLCLTAPPADARDWAPRFQAAVRVARGEADDPIDQAVFSAVESWAQLAVLGHNKQNPTRPLRLKTTFLDGAKVRYLQGEAVFPEGMQPAFGLRNGYLVLASSPAELRRFKGGSPAASSASVPLLRLSFRAWKAYLKERREPLAAALAAKEKLTRERAREKIDGLRNALELLDRLELRQSAGNDRVTFTLAVQFTQPLKKP
jgi:hypothetical protein